MCVLLVLGWMFQSWVVCWAFSKVGGADLPCYMGKTFAVKVEFSLEALFLIKYGIVWFKH